MRRVKHIAIRLNINRNFGTSDEDEGEGGKISDRELVTRYIRKKFGDSYFDGDVAALLRVEKGNAIFSVTYSDGDDEELSASEIRSLLIDSCSDQEAEAAHPTTDADKEGWEQLGSYEQSRQQRMNANTQNNNKRGEKNHCGSR